MSENIYLISSLSDYLHLVGILVYLSSCSSERVLIQASHDRGLIKDPCYMFLNASRNSRNRLKHGMSRIALRDDSRCVGFEGSSTSSDVLHHLLDVPYLVRSRIRIIFLFVESLNLFLLRTMRIFAANSASRAVF